MWSRLLWWVSGVFSIDSCCNDDSMNTLYISLGECVCLYVLSSETTGIQWQTTVFLNVHTRFLPSMCTSLFHRFQSVWGGKCRSILSFSKSLYLIQTLLHATHYRWLCLKNRLVGHMTFPALWFVICLWRVLYCTHSTLLTLYTGPNKVLPVHWFSVSGV